MSFLYKKNALFGLEPGFYFCCLGILLDSDQLLVVDEISIVLRRNQGATHNRTSCSKVRGAVLPGGGGCLFLSFFSGCINKLQIAVMMECLLLVNLKDSSDTLGRNPATVDMVNIKYRIIYRVFSTISCGFLAGFLPSTYRRTHGFPWNSATWINHSHRFACGTMSAEAST